MFISLSLSPSLTPSLSLLLCLSPFSSAHICMYVYVLPTLPYVMPHIKYLWSCLSIDVSIECRSLSLSLLFLMCQILSPFLTVSLCLSFTYTLSLSLIRSPDWSQSLDKCYVSIRLSPSFCLSLCCLSPSLSMLRLLLSIIHSVLSQGVLREGVTMRSIVDFSTAYCALCASFHFWQWGNLKSLQNWAQSAAHTHTETKRDTYKNTQAHT